MHKHIVKKMPMFGSSMHPSSFQPLSYLEDCSGNIDLAICAEFEQEAPVVISFTNYTRKTSISRWFRWPEEGDTSA